MEFLWKQIPASSDVATIVLERKFDKKWSFISGSISNLLSSYFGPEITYQVAALAQRIFNRMLQCVLSLTELDRSKWSMCWLTRVVYDTWNVSTKNYYSKLNFSTLNDTKKCLAIIWFLDCGVFLCIQIFLIVSWLTGLSLIKYFVTST